MGVLIEGFNCLDYSNSQSFFPQTFLPPSPPGFSFLSPVPDPDPTGSVGVVGFSVVGRGLVLGERVESSSSWLPSTSISSLSECSVHSPPERAEEGRARV